MPPVPPTRRRAPGPGARIAILFTGALLAAGLIMALSGFFSSDEAGTPERAESVRKALPTADSLRPEPPENPIAVVVRPTALRATPSGRRIDRIGTKTEFKSRRVLAVDGRRGDWLRVIVSELPNGKRGWVAARDVELGEVDYEMRVDLSARRLVVMRNGRVVRRIRTAVGEQGTPTPRGDFAITDKVPFTDRGSPYGCCALALSAHQTSTPSEWRGGDRIAIHATPIRSSIGQSVTLGCMRVPTADARWLMRAVPLGTQVSIRA